MDDPDFFELLSRVKRGDEAACRNLVEHYGKDVERMVRRTLPGRIRRQFDTIDFTQIVWNSVIRNCRNRPEPFENEKQLLGFLSAVAANKVAAEFRRQSMTQKFDISREEPLRIRRGDREVTRDFPSDEPTLSEQFQAKDRYEQILSIGRTDTAKAVVELRKEGLSVIEIASRLGMDQRSVRRIIDDLYAKIEARLG